MEIKINQEAADIIESFITGEIQEDNLWMSLIAVVDSFPESERARAAYSVHMKLMQAIHDNKTFGAAAVVKNISLLDFMSFSLEVFSGYNAHEYMEAEFLELIDDYNLVKYYLAADDKKYWLTARGTNRMNICRRARARGFDMRLMQKSIDSRKELLFQAARAAYSGAARSVASSKYTFRSMTVDSEANRFVIEDCSPELAAELKRLALKLTLKLTE